MWFTCCGCFEKSSDSLADASWLNTVTFVPPVTSGKVIKVYDGDTITIASKLPFPNSPIYKFPVRLLGIDCPEIKGSTENEKNLAKTARDALSTKINGKMVTLKNVSTEKYGRLLADVYIDGENMNNWMLANNHAVKYDGGTKSRPDNWI
jgi:endonuclease YncB( thermonuclease family)